MLIVEKLHREGEEGEEEEREVGEGEEGENQEEREREKKDHGKMHCGYYLEPLTAARVGTIPAQ